MKAGPRALWRSWLELFEEEPADEPRFDPAHLAEVLIVCVVGVGVLYWLLWGVMVFEGGLDRKLAALAAGKRGSELEGLFGGVLCAGLLASLAGILWRADRGGGRRRK